MPSDVRFRSRLAGVATVFLLIAACAFLRPFALVAALGLIAAYGGIYRILLLSDPVNC